MSKKLFALLLAFVLTVSMTLSAAVTAYADPEEGTGEEMTTPDPQPEPDAVPDTTDPGTTDPGTTDPGTTDPGTIDPGTTDPGTTDPGTTDPGTTDPGTTDPGTTDPGTTDPGTTDPGTTDPGTTDPGTTDPGTTDPGTTDPGTTDPGTTDPGTTDPGITDPGTTDPGTTDPGTTVPETNKPDTEPDTPAPSAPVRQPTVDLRLESLSIACGALHPAFDPDVYEYTVYVTAGAEAQSCAVAAESISGSVRVAVEGPETVLDTDIEKKIVTTGSSGRREYTIRVHVLTIGELLLDGVYYTASATPDTTGLPGAFQVVQLTVDGVALPAVQSADSQLLLVQFTSEQDGTQPLWYRYDTVNQKLYPAALVEYDGEKYVQLSDGQSFLYGEKNGAGQYYVYDKAGAEWIYQSGEYEQLPIVVPEPQKEFDMVTLVLGLWALIASALAAFLLLRRPKSEPNNVYFRPRFAVAEDDTQSAKEK